MSKDETSAHLPYLPLRFYPGRLMNRQWPLLLALGLLVALVLMPNVRQPLNIPTRDPGVFLYMARQILDGKIPYRDVWDHKPPMIYYINVLGLLIGQGSGWGIWVLEFLALYGAGVVGGVLMKRSLGIAPAIFATIAWLSNVVMLLERGNFTEEFALPFQFAALYLFWQSEKQGHYSWRGVLIGITGALVFLLKPNLIGIQLSILLFLVLTRALSRRWRDLFSQLATMFLGAVSIILSVAIYFAYHNALGDLWDNVFIYNFAYSTTAFQDKLDTFVFGLAMVPLSAIAIVILVASPMVIFYLWRNKAGLAERNALLGVSLIDLLVEFVLASLSGRPYPHNYIAWLPVFGILAAFFAYAIIACASLRSKGGISTFRAGLIGISFSIFLLAICFWPATFLMLQITTPISECQSTACAAAAYIQTSTSADDHVLMWGAETSLNYVTHRQSPSRFTYQYPLYTPGYQNNGMIENFLGDIKRNPPALIIDTSPSNEFIPPIERSAREKWVLGSQSYRMLPEMEVVFEYIASNYVLKERIGQNQWLVYVHQGK